MKKILIIALLSLFVVGCGEGVMEKESLDSVFASGEYIVIDVRTKEEYESGHVVGAINIPYDQIDENIKLDKNMAILVYCRSGARSKVAYEHLQDLGYITYDMGAFANVDLPKE